MDLIVDVSNVLDGQHEAANNAAIWLREHLEIPHNCTVVEQFEKYFNCRIIIADRNDAWLTPDKIVFETGTDVTAFVLKWS